MKQKIKLGDKVRCKHTGYIGIAIARTEFINGCIQYSVVPPAKKNEYPKEDISIDETSLEVISKPKKKKKTNKKRTYKRIYGATTISNRMRGY